MKKQLKILLSLILLILSAWAFYWTSFELINKGLVDVALTLPLIGEVTKGHILLAAQLSLCVSGALLSWVGLQTTHGKTRVIIVNRVQIDDHLVRQLLWQMIVMDPNAPLTEESGEYEAQKTEAEEAYVASVQAAEGKYAATCQRAETRYTEECAAAEEAYRAACLAAESLPYSAKNKATSEAYSTKNRVTSQAYSTKNRTSSEAYSTKSKATSDAYITKTRTIEEARAELETAFNAYLGQRPQLVEFARESIEGVRQQALSAPESLN